jgi:hypothetical protein
VIVRRFPLLIAAAALVVLPRGGDDLLRPVATRAAVPAVESQDAHGLPDALRVRIDVATRRAVRWLLQQQVDGAWRSPQYGVLRGGQAYTPFVLHALLSVPARVRDVPRESIAAAVAFIRSRMIEDGALGYHDPDVLEYPVYATSYAIRAFKLAVPDDPLIGKMAAWLAGMQLTGKKGFEPASPAWGGWSFGVRTLAPGVPGHVDLAHTRRALEALADAGALTPEIREAALKFLGLVQKVDPEIARFSGVPGFEVAKGAIPFDGGFFFSPIVLVANKALWERPASDRAAYFRSYSTATADGLLALLAAGLGPDHERVRGASKWLRSRGSVDVTGVPPDHPEPWVAALRFYQLAAFSEAASAIGLDGWKEPFAKRLLELQRADGSFVNLDSALMKEDDPVLATTLALISLSRIVPATVPESAPVAPGKRADSRSG